MTAMGCKCFLPTALIAELVQTEDMYSAVRDGLRALNKLDLDKLIASASPLLFLAALRTISAYNTFRRSQIAASQTREPSTTSSKPASSRVAQMLNVRNVVRSMPALQSAIQGSRSHLLRIISEVSFPYAEIALGTKRNAEFPQKDAFG
jgi:DNA mismatch repair protein MSH4